MTYVYFSSSHYLYISAITDQIQWYRKKGRRGNSTNKYTIQIDKKETGTIYVYFSFPHYLYISAITEQIQWDRKKGRRGKSLNNYKIQND